MSGRQQTNSTRLLLVLKVGRVAVLPEGVVEFGLGVHLLHHVVDHPQRQPRRRRHLLRGSKVALSTSEREHCTAALNLQMPANSRPCQARKLLMGGSPTGTASSDGKRPGTTLREHLPIRSPHLAGRSKTCPFNLFFRIELG